MTIYWPDCKMHPPSCSGGRLGSGPHAELRGLAVANDNAAASMFDVAVHVEFLDGSGRSDSLTEIWRIISPGEMRFFSLRSSPETFRCDDPQRPAIAIWIEFRDEDKRRWIMRYGGRAQRANGYRAWFGRLLRRSRRPPVPIRSR